VIEIQTVLERERESERERERVRPSIDIFIAFVTIKKC
jgi:hypothetical protein